MLVRVSGVQVLARGGCVIAVTEEGNTELEGMCEAVIYIPRTKVWLSPMLTVIPLQVRWAAWAAIAPGSACARPPSRPHLCAVCQPHAPQHECTPCVKVALTMCRVCL